MDITTASEAVSAGSIPAGRKFSVIGGLLLLSYAGFPIFAFSQDVQLLQQQIQRLQQQLQQLTQRTARNPAKSSLKFDDLGDLSYLETSGNSPTRSLSATNSMTLLFDPYAVTLRGSGYWSQFQHTTTAEWYNSDLRFDRKFTDRFYLYALSGWERNVFSGIEDRYQGNGGAGYMLLNSDRQQLRLEPGVGYYEERRTDRSIDDSSQIRGAVGYKVKATETTQLGQEFEGYHNIRHPNDRRFRSESSLMVSISRYLGVKFSYIYLYRGAPLAGFVRVDRILTAGFYVNYSSGK